MDYFRYTLTNSEYFVENKMLILFVANGFLATLLLVMLFVDVFYKPIMGIGPRN